MLVALQIELFLRTPTSTKTKYNVGENTEWTINLIIIVLLTRVTLAIVYDLPFRSHIETLLRKLIFQMYSRLLAYTSTINPHWMLLLPLHKL